MTREEILAFFEKRQDAWRRLDAAALAADHAEDGVLDSPTAGTVQGRRAIEAIYRGWFTAFPDLDFRSEELLIDGDQAAQLITSIGTHRGEFCGLPATGKRFQVRSVFLFRFEANKIAYERRIYDFTSLLLQIGVLKAKPAF